ncbi:DUF5103 domain-containing protein [Olivibacter sp. SDN3]|uniref:type IX secretion system plug protein n=1 Tax=Olivibacter sp. SDN3 TaxID=2764720 RepID=UPI001650EE9C|nr:type IX secretion system plug protein domain-containing protein [Olivibacter sp. SDN3]QNL48704.1 DUF5103 domain-containing protein [Olivibacter sp. SDN3]
MKRLTTSCLLPVFLVISNVAYSFNTSQKLVYDNHDYISSIKSVQFYQSKEEQSIPILVLNNNEKLLMSFDDLRADNRTLYYTIEHCTANWASSNLSALAYIEGLTEDRIFDYKTSVNTLQLYTHYSFQFPTDGSMKPKLSGNYLLKVYEDGDQTQLLLTRRFYVVTREVGISTKVIPSFEIDKRQTNQKLNITLNLGNIQVNNPYQDIKVIVKQNRRDDIQEILSKPMFIKNNQLVYNDNQTLDFDGGNEFRSVDLRSFRLLSEHIDQTSIEEIRKFSLVADRDLLNETYAFAFDEDGKFFIRNNDFGDSAIESDYAMVKFFLESDTPAHDEDVYIVGLFNNYQQTEENKMTYDSSLGAWVGNLLLKQGIYHYTYTSTSENANKYNGSHFETENTYDILVYYQRPATRWEELVGYGTLVSTPNTRPN